MRVTPRRALPADHCPTESSRTDTCSEQQLARSHSGFQREAELNARLGGKKQKQLVPRARCMRRKVNGRLITELEVLVRATFWGRLRRIVGMRAPPQLA